MRFLTGIQCYGSTIGTLSCNHGFVQIWVQKGYNGAAKPRVIIIGSGMSNREQSTVLVRVDCIILKPKCCFSKRTLHSRSSVHVPLTPTMLPQTLHLHFLLFPTTYCSMQEYGMVTDKNGLIKSYKLIAWIYVNLKYSHLRWSKKAIIILYLRWQKDDATFWSFLL